MVDDGLSGLLCQPRDAADLAEKMSGMLALADAQRNEMGQRGSQKMVDEYDEKIVIDKYLSAIKTLV